MDRWHQAVLLLFLLTWAVNWVLLLLPIGWPPEGRWVEGLLPVLATATTLFALGRRLPLQNVLMATVLIAVISSGIAAVGVASGVPFGSFIYGDALGDKFFGLAPWPIPLLWVILIINGRGVSQLILRPWRETNYYGFWVIGLTCLLMVMFDFCLEPLAVRVKHYWFWLAAEPASSASTAPWVNSLGWFVSALGTLAFTGPWLINKQPIQQPPDCHPLVVWLLLNLWVTTGNALHHFWLAAGVSAFGNGVVALQAIRGARC